MRTQSAAPLSALMAVVVTVGMMSVPIRGICQSSHSRASDNRQKTKNDWRNVGIGSAVLGLLGLVKGDKTIAFVGTAGALYSANRYEQDRKSQDATQRARAEMFRRQSYDRNGHHYVRRSVKSGGQSYYQFVERDRH